MGIVKIKDLIYEYIRRDEEGNVEGITTAVDDVSLDIEQGSFVAILGHNGSGKSTLAKHLNAILYPTEGTVWVDGKDTQKEEYVWDIRQTAGMVFQNPDNQIIGQVVEEDVGFGPENMGVPTKGDLGARGGKSQGGRYVPVSEVFTKQTLGRPETKSFHSRSDCHASQMYYT